MYLLFGSECYTTKNSNINIMKKILELRKEKAKILGFENGVVQSSNSTLDDSEKMKIA